MRRFVLSVALSLAVFALTSCASQPNKEISIEHFMRAVLAGGVLQPGEGTQWKVDKNAFIKTAYGSELLNPESKKFQEMRNLTGPDGSAYIKPPLDILFKDIDPSQPASVTYIFDAGNKLSTVAYLYVYDGAQKGQDGQYVYNNDQMAQYEDALNALLALIEGQGDSLVLEPDSQKPDMAAFDYKNDRLRLRWTTADASQSLEIGANVLETQSLRQPSLSVIISNSPAE